MKLRMLTILVGCLFLEKVSLLYCPWGNSPVCGADHLTYPSQCALATAYVELLHFGPCNPADSKKERIVCP